MIFYYSGTGNTRYAAVTIGKAIGDKRLLFIPALVREIETGKRSASSVFAGMADDEAIGFMFPVYSWGVPPIVSIAVRSLYMVCLYVRRRGWCRYADVFPTSQRIMR